MERSRRGLAHLLPPFLLAIGICSRASASPGLGPVPWDPRLDPAQASTGHAWVAVESQLDAHVSGARAFGAMLVVNLPFDRIADKSHALPPAPPPSPALTPQREAPASPTPVRAISAAMARDVIRAALKRERLDAPDDRLDARVESASRAALLPELRLRVMRIIDESERMTPVEWDPLRLTHAGDVSLRLEARATWHLDRLVFTHEELAIERLRQESAAAQERLVHRVLEQLFIWQKARARLAEAGLADDERMNAELVAAESETRLDVMSDDCFARWRARLASASTPSDGITPRPAGRP